MRERPERSLWALIPGPQPPTDADYQRAADMAEEFANLVAAYFKKLEDAPLLWEGDNA